MKGGSGERNKRKGRNWRKTKGRKEVESEEEAKRVSQNLRLTNKESQWKINKWGKERRAIEETKNKRDRRRKRDR